MQINIEFYKRTNMTDTTKHILIENSDKETEHPNPKIPRKKIASQSDNWITTAKTYSTQESQLTLLVELQCFESAKKSFPVLKDVEEEEEETNRQNANLLLAHLKTKQSGYKSQDKLKELYDPDRFIQIPRLIELLIESKLACFYCRKWATLFYENVRDPRQWSLERLSNAEGHNRDNVVIACLECNMRRRTMYYERYIATKQLKVNKLDSESNENDLEI